jgi:hypothetical protein
VGCNNKTRALDYVSACYDRYSKDLVDCPWDPNAAIEFGRECAGDLFLAQGTAPSAACESSFPVTLAGAYPNTPQSPAPSNSGSGSGADGSSGTNTGGDSSSGGGSGDSSGGGSSSSGSGSSSSIGPIIGAVCGGIAAVVVAVVLFIVVRKRRAAKQAAVAAWETNTNSKEEDKLEEQPGSNSMLDTFVSMHSGDDGSVQPGGGPGLPAALAGGSLVDASVPPTAPATPAVVVSSLGTAAAAGSSPAASGVATGGEGPAPLPADYRTLDSALTPAPGSTPTAAALASAGTVGSGGLGRSGTTGSGGASVVPSATPSGRHLMGSGSAMWAIDFRELKLLHVVGAGSFGRVYAAEWHSTSVACKMLLQDAASTAGSGSLSSGGGSLASTQAAAASLLAKLEEEADIMLNLRHPNVVQIMGICTDPPCLVTEFCAKGSMTDCLRAARGDANVAAQLTWRRRLSMALDARRGLLYLHSRAIVHRDLKGPNLLVDEAWRVKVSDFNLSKHLDKTRSTSLAAMNPRWLANEVMQGERANQASDVFALAVVLWELLTWELPWATTSPWQVVGLVLGGGRLPLPAGPEAVPGPDRLPPAVLGQYTALVQSCWAQNPAERPSLQTVVEQLRDMLAQLGGEAA